MLEWFAYWIGWATLYHVSWVSGREFGNLTVTVRPWITAANWKRVREMVAAHNNRRPEEIGIISVTKL